MQIEELLTQKKAAIKKRWLDLIIETYPADGREFFRQRKNRFANPVGAAISQQVDELFEVIAGDGDDDVSRILDRFVKIRSVQDFSPSQALGYILYLKQAVRENLAEDIRTNELYTELLDFETRVDRLLLSAFDVYSQSRDQLHAIRADEMRRSLFVALKRARAAGGSPPRPDDSQDLSSN
jgi:hypothetical protein